VKAAASEENLRKSASFSGRAADQQQAAFRSVLLRFSNQPKMISFHDYLLGSSLMVARISFGLLIATSLTLTAYFGATAWRLCNDQQNDTTGWSQPFRLTRTP
jgi:hypothetical protein